MCRDWAGDLATVPAGPSPSALLRAHGRVLPQLGDVDARTVAGGISTGTREQTPDGVRIMPLRRSLIQ